MNVRINISIIIIINIIDSGEGAADKLRNLKLGNECHTFFSFRVCITHITLTTVTIETK